MKLKTRLAVLALSLFGLSGLATHAADPPSSKEKPLTVLFLGDKGPHRPADRYPQLAPVLTGRGIEMTYTENVSDLNAGTLGKYDALVIYANTTQIGKDQEKALLDFVANGGGFVPLHCASFCFLNSPEYIALVGAQFQKHGTGQFETTVVDPDHPIIKGLEPFRTWDETYVHTKHNTKDRHRPPDSRRSDRAPGAVDLGPDAGERARLLHRLRPAAMPGPGAIRASMTSSNGASDGRPTRGTCTTLGRTWRRA